MVVCPLCLSRVEKFARSHIFPLALARYLGAGAPLASFGAERVGVAPRGIYARVVCFQCESESGPADEELVRFVREVNARPTRDDGAIELLELAADSALLQRAFVQMFFRAALCELPSYRSVTAEFWRMRKIRLALRGYFSVFRTGIEVALFHRSDALGRTYFFTSSPVSADGSTYFELGLPGFSVAIADGFLPQAFRLARIRRLGKVYVLSAPIDAREHAGLSEALAQTGGFEAIRDFFSSPRAKY